MSRNYIKAGPVDSVYATEYLGRQFNLTPAQSNRLISRACMSPTGMASRELPDGRRVWVSALVTIPRKYMIEVE